MADAVNSTTNHETAPPTLQDVEGTVTAHYPDELWRAVKVNLGVIASLSLKGRDHCLVMVVEGPSGRGKSIVVRVVMPDREATEKFLCRVDDFTPASFVSHAANRSAKKLAEIDLLPKIKDTVMLTKELAPLFRDDEKELRQTFARLTSVLDGNGYVTTSGTHGKRGYQGRYVFNWIGATTPIPDRTHKVMAQLGNRILFYEIPGEESSEEELMEFAENYGTDNAVAECCKAVNDFIESHFQKHPVEGVDPKDIKISKELLRRLVRNAKLIAAGRVEVNRNDSNEVEVGTQEGPQRIILLLQTLARGLALADDRTRVNAEDIDPIRHIAFSCIPRKRRDLLRALMAAGGNFDAPQVEKTLRVSRPTALVRMKELAATGVVRFTEGNQATSTPAKITMADDWKWLLEGTPLKENEGACESEFDRSPPLTPFKESGGVRIGRDGERGDKAVPAHTPESFQGVKEIQRTWPEIFQDEPRKQSKKFRR